MLKTSLGLPTCIAILFVIRLFFRAFRCRCFFLVNTRHSARGNICCSCVPAARNPGRGEEGLPWQPLVTHPWAVRERGWKLMRFSLRAHRARRRERPSLPRESAGAAISSAWAATEKAVKKIYYNDNINTSWLGTERSVTQQHDNTPQPWSFQLPYCLILFLATVQVLYRSSSPRFWNISVCFVKLCFVEFGMQ